MYRLKLVFLTFVLLAVGLLAVGNSSNGHLILGNDVIQAFGYSAGTQIQRVARVEFSCAANCYANRRYISKDATIPINAVITNAVYDIPVGKAFASQSASNALKIAIGLGSTNALAVGGSNSRFVAGSANNYYSVGTAGIHGTAIAAGNASSYYKTTFPSRAYLDVASDNATAGDVILNITYFESK